MKRNGVIVFDLDGTFWQKEPCILADISLLIQLLAADFAVAVCSGNEAKHVIRVLVRPLLKAMYEQEKLTLAQNFFAFFQLGGGLAKFDSGNLAKLQESEGWARVEKKLFATPEAEIAFQPDYIDGDYVGKQSIGMEHDTLLKKLIEDAKTKYEELCNHEGKYYDPETNLTPPEPNKRGIKVRGRRTPQVVQYTLKPLLSERHYTKAAKKNLGYKDSIRYKIAHFMNNELEQAGVGLTATAAGGTSVDVTNHDLSKTTAIEYLRAELLNHEKYQNFLYFGDEFHLGGNDVVVALKS